MSASSSVGTSLQTIPLTLRRAVQTHKAAWLIFDSPRWVAVGLQLPNNKEFVAYFVYSLADLDQTLNLLRNILLGVVAAAAALAGAVGAPLAARTIRPLRAASDAASLVAKGQLDTRLEDASGD